MRHRERGREGEGQSERERARESMDNDRAGCPKTTTTTTATAVAVIGQRQRATWSTLPVPDVGECNNYEHEVPLFPHSPSLSLSFRLHSTRYNRH